MALELLGDWSQGWTILGDADNHTELAIAYGEDQTIADNLYWDFEPEEDESLRAEQFRTVLHALTNNSRIVETDVLTGLVIDITEEFDWTQDGRARGLYSLKSEESGAIYAANSDDTDHLVSLMENYTDASDEPAS